MNTSAATGTTGKVAGINTATKIGSDEELLLQAGDNITVTQNGQTIAYSLNSTLLNMTAATFVSAANSGKTVVITGDSIIHKDGDKLNTSKADGNTISEGSKTNVATVDGNTVTNGVNKTTTNAGSISVTDGTHTTSITPGSITGLTNTTWDRNEMVENRAATEGQLRDLENTINKSSAAAKTEITANSGQAANGTSGNINLTSKAATDGHTVYDVKLNDTVTLGTDSTKQVVLDGNSGTVTAGTGANQVKIDGTNGTVTAKDVTASGTVSGDTVQGNTVKAGNVTVNGANNTITGLSNTSWSGSTTEPSRAATEGQLRDAIQQSAGNASMKYAGDTGGSQSMNLQNGTFNVNGDSAIKTTSDANGIKLSLDQSQVNLAYRADGGTAQTVALPTGLNFQSGTYTTATVGSNGDVKYDVNTSEIVVGEDGNAYANPGIATSDNVADALNQMKQQNNGDVNQLKQAINNVTTETQRVGAHAAALAALKPIQYDPLEPTQIMAGVGNYRGETAAALGVAHYTNEDTMFNIGVSVGGNHNMVNAGVPHKFGSSAEKKNIPDRYKAGPISSVYVMQDEMSQLRAQNEAQKAQLDKQQSEIEALKAAVDQLLAAKA